MQQPVVTLRVSLAELQIIDSALELLCEAAIRRAKAARKDGAVTIDTEEITRIVTRIANTTADGYPRQIARRTLKLREDIGLI